ncbi:MAG: hypothetical protein PHH01_02105 [Patescibacteria group bacterium]|nr:hypothetical protein [Patescibacteria group bacterium]
MLPFENEILLVSGFDSNTWEVVRNPDNPSIEKSSWIGDDSFRYQYRIEHNMASQTYWLKSRQMFDLTGFSGVRLEAVMDLNSESTDGNCKGFTSSWFDVRVNNYVLSSQTEIVNHGGRKTVPLLRSMSFGSDQIGQANCEIVFGITSVATSLECHDIGEVRVRDIRIYGIR